MNCNKKYDLLSFHKKELPSSEMALVEAHLKECPSCREKLEWIIGVSAAVNCEEIEPTIDFELRLMETLQGAVRKAEEESTRPLEPAEEQMPSVLEWVIYLIKNRLEPIGAAGAWAVSISVHLIVLAVLMLIFSMSPPQKPFVPGEFDVNVQPPSPREPEVVWNVKPPAEGIAEQTIVQPPELALEAPGFFYETELTGPTMIERPDFASDKDELLPLTRILLPPIEESWIKVQKRTRDMIFACIAPYRELEKNNFVEDSVGKMVDSNIRNGLKWLAKVQDPLTGKWSPEQKLLKGDPQYAAGLTGLALLCFSGEGETHLKGEFKENVQKGINYLLSLQVKDGNLAGLISPIQGNYMYNHGMATLALVDLYSMTQDANLLMPINSAIKLICTAQNESGAWGYTIKSDTTDTSVSAWQIMALRYAFAMDINRDAKNALISARKWLDEVTNEEGKVGYREKDVFPNGYYALTAAGMFCRQIMATSDLDAELLKKQENLLLVNPPVPLKSNGQISKDTDYYYYFFASICMYQQGGEGWKKWSSALRDALIATQETNGENAGSWKAIDKWGDAGGKLYSTTMAILSLQAHFRYPKFKNY